MFGIKKRDEAQGVTVPPIDVLESDAEILVVADVPGVPAGAAQLSLEQEHLRLEATGGGRRFRRELIVPPSVDGSRIEAAVKAGVLTVRLPKREPFKPRQIPVRAA